MLPRRLARHAAPFLTLLCFALLSGATSSRAVPVTAAVKRDARGEGERDPLAAAHSITVLFGDEIRDAGTKLKWRGERLNEDTRYAAALTGLSWREAWTKSRRFEATASARRQAWEVARGDGQDKEAVALGLSLLLMPDTAQDAPDRTMLTWLREAGVSVDRVVLGILEAPDRLPGLPAYRYAAADLLAVTAAPRLLPFLMHLVNSDDTYLRSRALLGLGVMAYRESGSAAGSEIRSAVFAPLREYGLSAGERELIAGEIAEAANSGAARVRMAAALAAALMNDEANGPVLQKLVTDRAYVLTPSRVEKGAAKMPRRIAFPVRAGAVLGLTRLNRRPDRSKPEPIVQGTFTGKALDAARRGGQEIVADRLPRDIAGHLDVTPFDALLRP